MASKTFTIEEIGDVTVYKRRGSRRLNLRIVSGQIRVTQPMWLPYAAGVQFAKSNQGWLAKQRLKSPNVLLEQNIQIGKEHTLVFEQGESLRTRITSNHIIVYVPAGLDSNGTKVQNITKIAVKRALKNEAESVLPGRLANCARQYGFTYTSVHCKSMRTRWGSCNNQKVVTLNIFLMMVPWELIDYVLLHELVHTEHLNHGADFWDAVGKIMPDYKERRKQLKTIQHTIAHLQ